METHSIRSAILQYLLIGLSSLLFWTVYYFFSNQNVSLSIFLAASDTLLYGAGYLIVVQFLLPRFMLPRKLIAFGIGFMVIIVLVCVGRIFSYKIATSLYAIAFNISITFLIYLFTTTTFILAATVGVRMAIDLLKSQRKIEEINKVQASTELNFLKEQLNPHFLFNSLNTLYGSIPSENETAKNILLKLSDMLRYQLYECSNEKVDLHQEIRYINDYIDLQQLRRNKGRLQVTVNIEEGMEPTQVAPLLLIPLVENAFKHVSKWSNKENWISVSLSRINGNINFAVRNSFDRNEIVESPAGGIGLTNIKKRLELLFGEKYSLHIEPANEIYSVSLTVPVYET